MHGRCTEKKKRHIAQFQYSNFYQISFLSTFTKDAAKDPTELI